MRRAAPRLATAVLAIGIWVFPPPDGLSLEAWRLFAIFAAAIFAVVANALPILTASLIAVAAAKDHFGQSGLYVVAVLSGLTDMDAITLSITQMVNAQNLPSETGWRLILTASMSNLVFKAGVVAIIGNRKLALRIAIWFAAALAGGAALLIFWPG